jgi:CysZ protein
MSNSTILTDFILGFLSCFRAFSFIASKSLWRVYLMGYLISIICIIFLFWGGWSLVTQLNNFLVELFFENQLADQSKQLIKTGTGIVMRYFLLAVFWLLLFKTSKYIILIILSPLFAYVSEKAESLLSGKEFKFDIYSELKNILRGMMIALRNMLIELFWFAGLGILSLIFPPLAPINMILLTLIGFYFYGYSMIDYIHERWMLNVREGTARIRLQKGRAAGLGAGFMVLSFIPFLGPVLASINAAVGAVLSDPLMKKRE